MAKDVNNLTFWQRNDLEKLRLRFLITGSNTMYVFLTASKYCGSGLKIDLVVVVLVVVVIKLLSNLSAFVKI